MVDKQAKKINEAPNEYYPVWQLDAVYWCKFIQFIVSKAGKLAHLEQYKKMCFWPLFKNGINGQYSSFMGVVVQQL